MNSTSAIQHPGDEHNTRKPASLKRMTERRLKRTDTHAVDYHMPGTTACQKPVR
ncbi:MAG: hypothetical protein Q8M57_07320 [Nitrosomonas sp.]|uniref:hypothetical protein n=1 Tax=Nitrosomonas sp. TaxID=42353 RepID=UPI00273330A5|nr:hypothetical protein [Nitrosomonas sp.]MDP3280840.1 hypothetical protein [Nitrosomonas sp.]